MRTKQTILWLWVNNQGARLAVETAGEGVGLAVGQPGIAGKGRRVWLSLTAGKGAGLAVKQRPTQWVCLAVRVSRGCGMRLVADSTAKGAFCFELDPHRVRLAATAARDVWLFKDGASDLSLSLDVSSSWVRKIKENIANHVSALHDVFVPLSKPLSAVALEGTEGTSGATPGIVDTTTTLSIVVASTSTVRPISIDDYEVTGADD
ncbi:hypothetical protein Tco_0528531 [Tanacetum coccineum]